MGYESLHIMELLSVQCLRVDHIILYCRLQCSEVLVAVLSKDSLGGTIM